MSAVLGTQHVRQFTEQGWCLVEGLLTDTMVAALAAEVERFQQEGLVRNVRTDGDGATPSSKRANLQLIPLFDKSPLLRCLPFAPRVADAVTRLIGDPYLLHLDQMFLKPARIGTGTSWHQDNAYFKIADPSKGTAMWVALHDATLENGTLHVIPGSHLTPFEHGRDPFSDHHIRCEVPEEKAVAIELPAGGVAFFNYGVAHSTKTNTTDHERAGLALHFLNTAYIPSDKGRGSTHLTGPDATGGVSEYGERVEDTWADEVERLTPQPDTALSGSRGAEESGRPRPDSQ